MKITLPPLVELTWDDHSFYQGDQDVAECDTVIQKSVGYLVEETEKVVKIAMSIAHGSNTTPTRGEVLVVDKRMLRGRPRVIRAAQK